MSFQQTITQEALLWRLARDAGLNPDPSAGEVTLKPVHEASFTHRLNMALEWAFDYYPNLILPGMLGAGSVVLGAGALVAAADIEDSPAWNFWEADPRLLLPVDRVALVGRATADGVVIEGKAAADTVVAFWRTAPPVLEVCGWETLPRALAKALVLYANAERLSLEGGLPAAAGALMGRAEAEMERLAQAAELTPGASPWLYNTNGYFNA